MFKAPFSFDGRIRRIEYFLSGIIGGVVSSIAWALGVGTFVLGAASGSAGGISIWFIDRSCCYDCFHLVLSGTGCETSARLKQIRLADFVVLCTYRWLDFCIVYVVCRWYGRS